MAKLKLKHCPFCGGKAAFKEGVSVAGLVFSDLKGVECQDCGRSDGHVYRTKTLAARSWNKRAPAEGIGAAD